MKNETFFWIIYSSSSAPMLMKSRSTLLRIAQSCFARFVQSRASQNSDVLQLRVLFSKTFGFCHPRLASLLRLFFPVFVK